VISGGPGPVWLTTVESNGGRSRRPRTVRRRRPGRGPCPAVMDMAVMAPWIRPAAVALALCERVTRSHPAAELLGGRFSPDSWPADFEFGSSGPFDADEPSGGHACLGEGDGGVT